MIRGPRRTWVGVFAALALVFACLAPARAASMGPIKVANASDLSLPATDTPAGFSARPDKDELVSPGTLRSWFGAHLQSALNHEGFLVGYHGWLDGPDIADLPFVTYDMYAFGSSRGAQAGQLTLSRLVQGLQTSSQDKRLPSNTTTWTDGTETFGAGNQPFAVSEVVFQEANILVTIIAFNQGGTADAISEALRNATTVAVSCETFLKAREAASHSAGTKPAAAP
ncbi:MAG TPA: hypothetical protein VIJ28_23240 [Chloroflexota bacterium]